MSIFKKLFSKEKEGLAKQAEGIQWIPLTSMEQLNAITEKSNNKIQAVFKHSTRCGISRSILKQFERQENIDEIDFYYLDLLSFRELSNEVAATFQVTHQSPQLLVIKNETVLAHGSHYDIMSVQI